MAKVGDLEIKVGCDPEVFVRARNKFICADGLVHGTKRAPQKIIGGMVQIDGMALEFGIDPVKTENGFVRRVSNVVNRVKRMIPEDLEMCPNVPCVTFDEDVFEAAPRHSKELGCDPDYDAYTGEFNPRPDGDVKFRTTSGHIHVGWTKGMDPLEPTHFMACRMLAISMDYWLGVPSVGYWDVTPEAIKRRKLYGRAGAFRPKPYGMEYRTLSSRWLMHGDLMRFVYRQTIKAVEDLLEGNYRIDEAQKSIINDNQQILAHFHCKANNIEVPKPPKEFQKVKAA